MADEKKQVSIKPDETIVSKLRALAKEAKDDVVMMPCCTFKEAVDKENNTHRYGPVNLGELLQFVADMAE